MKNCTRILNSKKTNYTFRAKFLNKKKLIIPSIYLSLNGYLQLGRNLNFKVMQCSFLQYLKIKLYFTEYNHLPSKRFHASYDV